MQIRIEQIPVKGVRLEETVSPAQFDLDTQIVSFKDPITVRADVTMITNVVSAEVTIQTSVTNVCTRCLTEFKSGYQKSLKLNYPVEKTARVIVLDHDIRDEVLLDAPIQTLCSNDCRGLCPRCGQNLNEGSCTCQPD